MRAIFPKEISIVCEQCSNAFMIRNAYVKHRQKRGLSLPKYCSRKCTGASQTKALNKEVILENSIPEPNSGCWLWISSGSSYFGYGRIGLNQSLAHRVSYEAFKGKIPSGLLVRHICDNPPCVNPDHLLVGTHFDNRSDALLRRRAAVGENSPNSKFTNCEVAQIKQRLRNKERVCEIARSLEVPHSRIQAIASGKSWNYVD